MKLSSTHSQLENLLQLIKPSRNFSKLCLHHLLIWCYMPQTEDLRRIPDCLKGLYQTLTITIMMFPLNQDCNSNFPGVTWTDTGFTIIAFDLISVIFTILKTGLDFNHPNVSEPKNEPRTSLLYMLREVNTIILWEQEIFSFVNNAYVTKNKLQCTNQET